jgi:hypothetical protein
MEMAQRGEQHRATEQRGAQRVGLDAQVRVRAAGSSGRGIACRVVESGPRGIRLYADQRIDPGWFWIEILKTSGRPLEEPVEARVVRVVRNRADHYEFACAFD